VAELSSCKTLQVVKRYSHLAPDYPMDVVFAVWRIAEVGTATGPLKAKQRSKQVAKVVENERLQAERWQSPV
jgi:hypothetical protein